MQKFETEADPSHGPDRLARLRAQMHAEDLDGFLVPRADAHQGEYVATRDARLAWLTGFTGSAGFCAALRESAGVFVDGRYRVQVKKQVADCFTPVDWPEIGLAEWLLAQNPIPQRLGFDPWLHTVSELNSLREKVANRIELVALTSNLLDRIWRDQPPRSNQQISNHPLHYTGETAAAKRERCAAILAQAGDQSAFISQTDSIAWLLNIRGADIPRVPVALCFAVLHQDGAVQLFIEPTAATDILLGNDVTVLPQEAMNETLAQLSGVVRIDPATCPSAVKALLEAAGCAWRHDADPCLLPKACKNAVEIANTAEAHLRDATAMCEFLNWLDAQPPGSQTEIDVVRALETYRQNTKCLKDLSFDTICGSGPNAAIIHYRVTEESNRTIKAGDMLLIDSGGQYLDGTTDITRTVAIGAVDADRKAAFTRVLQGMIAISQIRWPDGLTGRDLDPIARQPLWLAGQDYPHGTGHGVGCFLGVHEGPQRLSRASKVSLAPGMILSNEPGFYKEGHFGVRIENLVVVQSASPLPNQTVSKMLEFQTLTWVPIDQRLIVTELLSAGDRAWLNNYHQSCYDKIAPRLGDSAKRWLAAACSAL